MKRVIITGATGFVGANLARRLLQDGSYSIHLLVRPGYNSWRIDALRDRVQLHEIDFRDSATLFQIIRKIQPEWIFHLAVYGAYSWQKDLHQMIETNVIGTINLIQACLKVGFEVFVNTGSSSEYGSKNHAPSETEWLEPNSHYAVTKASATLFCRYTAQQQNVHIPTLRLYSTYGPYEDPHRLLPTLILYGLQGRLPLLTNPKISRDFVYVDDVSEAYLLTAMEPNQELGAVYNVGTGIRTSLGEVVEVARRMMSIASEPNWGSMPPRQWDTKVWMADNHKIRRVLNWQPCYPFERGFQAMMRWFHNNPTVQKLYYESLKI